ncbi:uncharacterized protein AMSG_08156 [Thecamonas trahens ATCC 50062]|uniref:Uncharacterized protein n=1 Tax=Thecamonas trahens ATCC 50062 TaxID=461836 RepID=A0A0L0DHS0_THETB|nr:hypothetical protein AMSG_08156 [Thecamonas trahens ATCC 50062]KNC51919.1 hypothetical protein AMSG_08156 [Thecamonas trahens ATCC 50062]|eukprot:XP_013755516.1 hypothetical protein AMSG_08156 [Thecamonas trahens ATCC 50062]
MSEDVAKAQPSVAAIAAAVALAQPEVRRKRRRVPSACMEEPCDDLLMSPTTGAAVSWPPIGQPPTDQTDRSGFTTGTGSSSHELTSLQTEAALDARAVMAAVQQVQSGRCSLASPSPAALAAMMGMGVPGPSNEVEGASSSNSSSASGEEAAAKAGVTTPRPAMKRQRALESREGEKQQALSLRHPAQYVMLTTDQADIVKAYFRFVNPLLGCAQLSQSLEALACLQSRQPSALLDSPVLKIQLDAMAAHVLAASNPELAQVAKSSAHMAVTYARDPYTRNLASTNFMITGLYFGVDPKRFNEHMSRAWDIVIELAARKGKVIKRASQSGSDYMALMRAFAVLDEAPNAKALLQMTALGDEQAVRLACGCTQHMATQVWSPMPRSWWTVVYGVTGEAIEAYLTSAEATLFLPPLSHAFVDTMVRTLVYADAGACAEPVDESVDVGEFSRNLMLPGARHRRLVELMPLMINMSKMMLADVQAHSPHNAQALCYGGFTALMAAYYLCIVDHLAYTNGDTSFRFLEVALRIMESSPLSRGVALANYLLSVTAINAVCAHSLSALQRIDAALDPLYAVSPSELSPLPAVRLAIETCSLNASVTLGTIDASTAAMFGTAAAVDTTSAAPTGAACSSGFPPSRAPSETSFVDNNDILDMLAGHDDLELVFLAP